MAADRNKKSAEGLRTERPLSNPHRRFTVLVVGGLMLVEGVGILAAVRFLGVQPQLTEAAQPPVSGDQGSAATPQTELPVTEVMAFNSKTGRVFIYHLTIFAEADTEHAPRLKRVLEQRQRTIEDRFSQIIRASDPKYLDEPGLETVRRQFKAALEEVVGPQESIKEILIPQFSKSRAD